MIVHTILRKGRGGGAEGAYKLVKCYFSELEVSSVNRETTIEKP